MQHISANGKATAACDMRWDRKEKWLCMAVVQIASYATLQLPKPSEPPASKQARVSWQQTTIGNRAADCAAEEVQPHAGRSPACIRRVQRHTCTVYTACYFKTSAPLPACSHLSKATRTSNKTQKVHWLCASCPHCMSATVSRSCSLP